VKRVYKIISVILHPIVVPTIGVILYFILIPNNYASQTKLTLLSLIFVSTYLIPLLILIVFKKLKLIKTFNADSIQERKLPVAMMIVLFYLLANTITNTTGMNDIGLLFYATSAALTITYICFAFQLKTSLHLLSLGISTSFFIILGFIYSHSFSTVVVVNILLAGVIANARLYLKAHTPSEVYLGFLFGFIAPLGVYYFL
jgi:membrane-associated phospholipid phosphatase